MHKVTIGAILKKIDTRRIAQLVADTLSKRFADIQIVKVDVEPDFDRDGDDILRIRVVFNGSLKDSDASLVMGATRAIRPKIENEIENDLFPLLSFVSQVDYNRGPKCETH